MKKYLYITLSVILWALLATIAHAGIEIWYIALLLGNFSVYGFGLSWETWFAIHNIFSVILFILGVYAGVRFGTHWWDVIYVKKDYPWRQKKYHWLAKYFD